MNDKPSMIVKAIGLAIFIDAALFIAAYFFAPDWLFYKLMGALPFVFVLFVAAPYGATSVYDFINWKDDRALVKQQKALELARLKLEYVRLHESTVEAKVEIVDNADETDRLRSWRDYWIRRMEKANERGGVVSWRGGFESELPYSDWRDSIAIPFIRQGWFTPIYQGSKTKLAQGITVAFILNELSANRCPTAPFGLPPKVLYSPEFEQSDSQAKHSEQSDQVFA